VKHPCRYEPELNPTYREMAEHYGLAVLPARPYKPRDKAKVEAGVQVAQRWIVAALRHTRFLALADLNEAIAPLLDRLNRRPFRKRRDACRASLFEQLDRPALRPLPVERYLLAQWKKVRPNIDYHVEIERHYYSVPYELVGEELEAHLDRSQPEARQPALRRTQDTCDHLGRNLECLCYFQSRMGSLAAQPEVQADHFFLPWLQHP
jgi:transposase